MESRCSHEFKRAGEDVHISRTLLCLPYLLRVPVCWLVVIILVFIRYGTVVSHELWMKGQVVRHATLCHLGFYLPKVIVRPAKVGECAARFYAVSPSFLRHPHSSFAAAGRRRMPNG